MAGRLIVAAAGSGKTELLVTEALSVLPERALLTTYTNRNTAELSARLRQKAAAVPPHIDVFNWCTFLFRHGIAPYQHYLALPNRIRQVSPERAPSYGKGAGSVARTNVRRYFLDVRGRVYNDRVSDLACEINARSGGRVVARLGKIYQHLYIDEVQDLAGWDLTLVELLLTLPASVTLVGDPRQRTYATTTSKKNARAGADPFDTMLTRLTSANLVTVQERTDSHRCCQEICSFADGLYPEQPTTRGVTPPEHEHAGVFYVRIRDVASYTVEYTPVALRWDKRADTAGMTAVNFGEAKGATHDRVLIFPTRTILSYLHSGTELTSSAKAKFYVALTRARHSAAIVVPNNVAAIKGAREWVPDRQVAASVP